MIFLMNCTKRDFLPMKHKKKNDVETFFHIVQIPIILHSIVVQSPCQRHRLHLHLLDICKFV